MFIRTKDEILKALDTDYMCGVKVYHTEKGMITEKLVVKTADNLAELCDGVIEKCISGNRFHYIWNFNKQEAIEVMNIDINKDYKEFYFGIFVEHNNKIDFISVAKMDNDGKLVLI